MCVFVPEMWWSGPWWGEESHEITRTAERVVEDFFVPPLLLIFVFLQTDTNKVTTNESTWSCFLFSYTLILWQYIQYQQLSIKLLLYFFGWTIFAPFILFFFFFFYSFWFISKSSDCSRHSPLTLSPPLQGEFPVSPQECRVESMASSGAACLPLLPWMLPTLLRCPSLPHTCLSHLQSARPSLMSAAPSVSLWHSICSSSPSCGLLSWMWVFSEVKGLGVFLPEQLWVTLMWTLMFSCSSPCRSRPAWRMRSSITPTGPPSLTSL